MNSEIASPPVARSWWQRNWKWVVPVGIIGALASIACFVGLILAFVFGILKGNDAYRGAIDQVRSSAAVIHELGEPIEPGWWLTGTVKIEGPSGSADFSTPLRGSIGRGTLYVTAEKKAGRWHYTVLEVAVEGKSGRIDLLAERNGV